MAWAPLTVIFRAQAPPFRAGLARPSGRALLADVLLERLQRRATGRRGKVRRRPQVLPVGADPVALAQLPRGDALEGVHQPGDGDLRRVGHEQVHVVVLAVHLDELGAEVGAHTGEHRTQGVQVLAGQNPAPILGHEDQMHVERRDDVSASTVVVLLSHRPSILSGMLVRYRYRIDPTPAQRQALARAFGCARVVYNDALAERRRAYWPGRSSATPNCNVAWSRWPRPGQNGRGWPRSPRSRWSRPARTPGVPTATGSTRARAAARAAGSAARGSEPSTATSRSGSPATALPSTGPGCLWPRSASWGCAGRGSCR